MTRVSWRRTWGRPKRRSTARGRAREVARWPRGPALAKPGLRAHHARALPHRRTARQGTSRPSSWRARSHARAEVPTSRSALAGAWIAEDWDPKHNRRANGDYLVVP